MIMELLVPFLTFVSVLMIGGAAIAAYSAKRRIRRRLAQLDSPLAPPPGERSGQAIPNLLGRIGQVFSRRSPSMSLRQQLANAGYYSSRAPGIYMGAKQVLLLVGLAGAAALVLRVGLATHIKVLVIVAAGSILFFVPNVLVAARRARRTREGSHHLPDAIDLLEICVASGMGMDMAWNSVSDEIRKVSRVLADEMALTNLEMNLGVSRGDAMRHMARRTGVDELSSLVSMLVQSERFGTSIGDTLKAFARDMRDQRGLKAQEAAEKMAVKILFPMVLFIFPAVLVVLVGPAAIQLFAELGSR